LAKSSSREKKLIRVPSDIVAKLNEAANRAGKPFYDYTSELLEQALRCNELGRPLKEIMDFFELMTLQRNAGLIITFSDLLNYLISLLYSKQEKELHKKWYEAGIWYGTYLQVKFRNRSILEVFTKILSESWWELSEVNLSKEREGFTLRCVSFTLSLERTKLLTSFLEGVINSIGYEILKKDCIRGMIILRFTEKRS